MSNKKRARTGAAERILKTASELFYKQGYRATGVNEVIEASGVAKATFYQHFPTKEALCLAYLREQNDSDLAAFEAYINQQASPLDRFLAVITFLEPWMIENGMKGCAFLNMVPEMPDTQNPVRTSVASHYARIRSIVTVLAGELIRSDPDRFGQLDARTLADDYMVVFTGAIALTEITQEMWPLKQGVETVRRLTGTAESSMG